MSSANIPILEAAGAILPQKPNEIHAKDFQFCVSFDQYLLIISTEFEFVDSAGDCRHITFPFGSSYALDGMRCLWISIEFVGRFMKIVTSNGVLRIPLFDSAEPVILINKGDVYFAYPDV